MKFNTSEILRFKQFFHGKKPATFQSFPEKRRCKEKAEIIHGRLTVKTKAVLEKKNKAGAAITMMISRGDGAGRKRENVTHITALFVDADGKCQLDALQSAQIKPHLIVETSPGRFHAYWKIRGLPIKGFKAMQARLAAKFDTDAAVTDSPRAMRVPGTINWKRGKPFPVRILRKAGKAIAIDWRKFRKEMGLGATEKRDRSVPGISPGKEDLRQRIGTALRSISADGRETWLAVGMAIHSEFPGSAGFAMWTTWSERSSKFDAKVQRQTWDGFSAGGGVGVGTLFWMASKFNAGPRSANGVLPGNELELAELFAANYADKLRYVEAERAWYVWSGNAWRKSTAAPQRLAREFLKAQAEISQDVASSEAGRLVHRIQSLAGLRNILAYACTSVPLETAKADFDKNPDLLAVKNGVVDLRSGLRRGAVPADMVSRVADIDFDQAADCPRWKRFILEISNDDKSTADFLQVALGYTLFGHTKEQRFFILVGEGANGKGVLMRTVHKILDEYAYAVPSGLLVSAFSNANAPSPALMKTVGRRFLMCTELHKNKPLDEAFVKQLSGGDPFSARGLYGDQEEIKPVGKLWISVNSMPIVTFDDQAMWRRIVPIPFRRQFKGKANDSSLEDSLAPEFPGILNWMLEGARRYEAEGLKLSKECHAFWKTLRKNVDTVGSWIASECIKEAQAEVQASAAYQSYVEYLRAERRKPLSRAEFKTTLEKKGFFHKRRNRFNVYVGLSLRSGD